MDEMAHKYFDRFGLVYQPKLVAWTCHNGDWKAVGSEDSRSRMRSLYPNTTILYAGEDPAEILFARKGDVQPEDMVRAPKPFKQPPSK